MAWAPAATFSGGGKRATSLLDRAVNDLSDTAHGFFPGLLSIGQAAIHDTGQIAHGKMGGFALDDIGKGMAKGFWDTSFIPALATGHPLEALHRASDRPFSAALDATLAFPAYTGAGRFSARLGQALGDTDLIEAGARMQGFHPMPAQMAEDVQGIDAARLARSQGEGEAFNSFDGLQAKYDDMLTREWNPFAPKGRKQYGGQQFVRRTQRTIPLTALTGNKELDALDDAFRNDSYLNPEGSFSDDPFRTQTINRAHTPLLGSMGDVLYDAIGQHPKLAKLATSRIGRNSVNQSKRPVQTDTDMEIITKRDLMRELVKEVQSRPELSHLTEKDIHDWVSQQDFLRSAGRDRESLADTADMLDPSLAYSDLSLSELHSMSPADAELRFLRFEVQPDHQEWADEIGFNPHDHQTMGEIFHHYREEMMNHKLDENGMEVFDPKIKLQSLSHGHHEAELSRKNVVNDQLKEFVKILDRAKQHGHAPVVKIAGREVALDVSHPNVLAQQLDAIATHPDASMSLVKDPAYIKERVGAISDEMGDMLDDGDAERIAYNDLEADRRNINSIISLIRRRQGELKNFENHSTHYLNHKSLYDLTNPHAKPQSDMGVPGAVAKLRELYADQRFNNMPDDLEHFEPVMQQLEKMKHKGGEHWKEVLGEERLSPERIAENRMRLSDNFADDGRTGTDSFFPMMPEIKNESNAARRERHRLDIDPELSPNDLNPGDPHELFLKGDFRVDSQLYDDWYKKTAGQLASHRIHKALKSMGRDVSKAEADQLLKSGHVMTSKEFREGGAQREFVVMGPDDQLTKDAASVAEFLEKLVDAGRKSGKVDQAQMEQLDLLEEAAKAAREFELPHNEANMGDFLKSEHVKSQEVGDSHRVLPTALYKAAFDEINIGKGAVGGLLRGIQDGWKFMVLHTRFASWMRNNLIGAHLMAAMSRGPLNYLKHLVNLTDPTYRKAFDALDDPRNADLLQSGSASLAREEGLAIEDGGDLSKWDKINNKRKRVQQVMSDFNAKWADDPMRKFHMMDQIIDQVKHMEQSLGKEIPITEDLVKTFLEDEGLRSEMARRTGKDLVDFGDLSARERKYLQTVFPFYSWMKGSTGAAQRLFADSPGRVAAMGSIGEQGSRYAHEQGGKFLPDFAKDFFDPGAPGGFALSTAGFFPYMTPVDFGTLGASLVPDLIPGDKSNAMSYNVYGSENLLSQMNPILSAFAQSALGKNAYFGTPLPNNSFGSNLMQSQAGLPLLKLAEDLIMNETTPTATTRKSRFGTLLNYAAFPIKDPRRGQIIARGVDELNERYKNPAAINELLPS